MDQLLKAGIIHFSKQYNLVRISKGNEWKETSWEDVQGANRKTTSSKRHVGIFTL